MSIAEEIINLIRINRISSTEVADCMGKTGVFENCKSVNRGNFACGKIRWVYACSCSNWTVHEQVRDVKKDEVVMIEAFDCEERAIIGELVTKFVTLYSGAVALITNANLRDANDLIKQNYPVWCKGFNPVGCFNTKPDITPYTETIRLHKEKYEGSIAVCDDTGVVIIPKEYHNKDFIDKLNSIEEQEDTWFEYLDKHKWNTFDIVCLKKYKG